MMYFKQLAMMCDERNNMMDEELLYGETIRAMLKYKKEAPREAHYHDSYNQR